MAGDRFVVLGVAQVRSPWFREVARWATSAMLPVEFVKAMSVEEVRVRLRSGRGYSALLVDDSLAGRRPRPRRAGARGRLRGGRRRQRPRRRGSGASSAPRRCSPAPSAATSCSRCSSRWPRRSPAPPATSPHRRRRPPHRASAAGSWPSPVPPAPGAPRSPPRWPRAWPATPGTATWCAWPTSRSTPTRRCSTAHPTSCPGSSSWSRATAPARRRSTTSAASPGTSPTRGYHLLLGLRRHRDWTAVRPRAFAAALDGLRRGLPDRGGRRRRRPRGRAGHRLARRRGAQRHRPHHDLGRRPRASSSATRAEGAAQPPAHHAGRPRPRRARRAQLLPVINRSPEGPARASRAHRGVRRAARRRRRRRAEPAARRRAPPPRRGPPRRRPLPRRLARSGRRRSVQALLDREAEPDAATADAGPRARPAGLPRLAGPTTSRSTLADASSERVEDQLPRRQAVLAPAVGRHEALVGRPAHAVGPPLRQRALVGRRPAAVVLEPGVRVGDRARRSRSRRSSSRAASCQGSRSTWSGYRRSGFDGSTRRSRFASIRARQ